MIDMAADAIKSVMFIIVAATLGPLAPKLRDEGAADWFAMIFLVVAAISTLIGGYYAYRVVRAAR